MLLWRFIKQNAFMNQEVRKYLWYAAGEIVLVVVGILIALQIDAWYEDRQDQERLQNYLNNIARTVADDLTRVEDLKSTRALAILESYMSILATSNPDDGDTDWYNRALVASANRALSRAQEVRYLSANAESFRALDSSGLMGALADRGLEFLLHDYYRTIDRIATIERDMNERIAELSMRFQTVTTGDLPPLVRREPLLMWDGESNDENEAEVMRNRRQYWQALTDPTTFELLRTTINEPLLREYEHLLSLGEHLVGRIQQYPQTQEPDDPMNGVFEANARSAHAAIVENGLPSYHSYAPFTAPSDSLNLGLVYTNVQIADDAMHVRYPGGSPWVYLYYRVGPAEITVDRLSKDFSRFTQIELELKREPETACSSLVLEIKDIEDAERGDLASVPLPLTADWQTYRIELSQFVEADLSDLHVAAGFLMRDDPCNFSIRSIRYQ